MTANPPMPCSDISELLPVLRRGAEELIRRCAAAGLKPKVTQTFRTWAYQDELYAQGRTKPGPIVTNAKGGYSAHNYRYAFDICQNIPGLAYDESKAFVYKGIKVDFFEYCGLLWEEMGGEWGGAWASFPDKPHMQFGAGLTDTQIFAGARLPDDAAMPWETAAPAAPGNEDDEMVGQMKLSINGQPAVTVPSILKDNSNYPNLPLLAAALNKGLGREMTVSYDAPSNTVLFDERPGSPANAIGPMRLSINGQPELIIPSVLINGSNYPNLRSLADALNEGLGLGMTVGYNAARGTVLLNKPIEAGEYALS